MQPIATLPARPVTLSLAGCRRRAARVDEVHMFSRTTLNPMKDLHTRIRVLQKEIKTAFDGVKLPTVKGTPKGYQYDLPFIILRCLQNFKWGNVYSALNQIGPTEQEMAYRRLADFSDRTKLLTQQQAMAVCSFLDLIFDEFPDSQVTTSMMLKLGWYECEHSVQDKGRQYLEKMYNFHCPVANDPAIQTLINSIEGAFAYTPRPAPQNIVNSFEWTDYVVLCLRDADWRTVHPELIWGCDSFFDFSDSAFRYFLPAYLRSILLNLGKTDPDEILNYVTFERNISALDRFEREAVCQYLWYQQGTQATSQTKIEYALERLRCRSNKYG